jgi:hypothetical protein
VTGPAWLISGRARPAVDPERPHRFDADPAMPPDHRGEPYCRCRRPYRNRVHDYREPDRTTDPDALAPVPDPSEPRRADHHTTE